MNVSQLLNTGAEILKVNKIPTYQLDSELMLSSLLKQQRESLIINSHKNVPSTTIINFKKLIARRANREPLAYILKKKNFGAKISL